MIVYKHTCHRCGFSYKQVRKNEFQCGEELERPDIHKNHLKENPTHRNWALDIIDRY